ncbi:O-methyltransferase [Paracoccus aerodenitrificans]|uniref:O-methyltransferase n=1 Tax=Paracoccus aerodenitrificans TaxID=3017781 RepID=UPI0022F0F080|nr:class I SAM-dependent methyltransferase [Paracoccus aerodenitrificans]WBU63121.1 class I SAM-dependent methyltransferase [Paracoccus aerodenitrificans]
MKELIIKTVRGSSCFGIRPESFTRSTFHGEVVERIEARIEATARLGEFPLWEKYREVENYARPVSENETRSIKQVRSAALTSRFYAWLVTQKRPNVVVEFGAAFGASGMYWLAGLESVGKGSLFSFEPNAEWFPIAQDNFRAISPRSHLVNGTFEDNVDVIDGAPEIIFIDAIHTRDFVMAQFAIVKSIAAPGALVIFDDINFSKDMKNCWAEIVSDQSHQAVWEISKRVGMIELPST